jgi:hypothetical protein
VASVFARMLGRRWQHFKHEEHLYHFEPATLQRLLADAGFRIVHRTARFGGKFVSPSFVAERAGKVHPVFAALSSPLRLLKGPSVYVNLRDEMVVLATKA